MRFLLVILESFRLLDGTICFAWQESFEENMTEGKVRRKEVYYTKLFREVAI